MKQRDFVTNLTRTLYAELVLWSSAWTVFAGQSEEAMASDRAVVFLGLRSYIPSMWQQVTPSSSMRVAQANVPGALPAELAVFYFGPGQGGAVDANVVRWRGQFRPVDGEPLDPVVGTLSTHGGFEFTWVEFRGDYARGLNTGPVGEQRPDQMLFAAITAIPKGNLYIQFHGNADAVLIRGAAFRKFVTGLRPVAQH